LYSETLAALSRCFWSNPCSTVNPFCLLAYSPIELDSDSGWTSSLAVSEDVGNWQVVAAAVWSNKASRSNPSFSNKHS